MKALESNITCTICHQHYTDPKFLPCAHYYCKKCIRSLALRTGLNKPFNCPECRKETTLPQGNVDNLQGAFFVNRMKEVQSGFEIVKQQDRSEAATQEGEKPICNAHKMPYEVYCFDCEETICHHCTMGSHKRHDCKLISEVSPQLKEALKQHLEQLRKIKTNLTRAVENITKTKSCLETQEKAAAMSIENSFSEVYDIIKASEQEALSNASEKFSKKVQRLSAQGKNLSIESDNVESIIDSTEHIIEQNDYDFISAYRGIQQMIQQKIEGQAAMTSEDLMPAEDTNFGVELSRIKEFKQLCQTRAKNLMPITQEVPFELPKTPSDVELSQSAQLHFATPIHCISGFSAPRDVAINSFGQVIVTEQKGIVVLDENGKRLNSYKSSKYNISDLFCVAVDASDDTIYLTGDQKIVKLDHGFHLLKEFSSKEKLHFRGLTITGDEVIVCQRDRGIVAYSKDLEYLRQIAPQKGAPKHFGGIRDVSSDKDGNLYVSDYENSCIVVFSKSGEILHFFKADRMNGPRGVWVTGQYIYVANWDSHSVSVITTGGKPVINFGQKGTDVNEANFKNPWGLCTDKEGLLYVVDQKNNKVRKYSVSNQ